MKSNFVYNFLTDEELALDIKWMQEDLKTAKLLNQEKRIPYLEKKLAELKKEQRFREIVKKLEKGESLWFTKKAEK